MTFDCINCECNQWDVVFDSKVIRAGKDRFPKEATFQQLFMHELALNTICTCAICSEFSEVYPDVESSNEKLIDIFAKI